MSGKDTSEFNISSGYLLLLDWLLYKVPIVLHLKKMNVIVTPTLIISLRVLLTCKIPFRILDSNSTSIIVLLKDVLLVPFLLSKVFSENIYRIERGKPRYNGGKMRYQARTDYTTGLAFYQDY